MLKRYFKDKMPKTDLLYAILKKLISDEGEEVWTVERIIYLTDVVRSRIGTGFPPEDVIVSLGEFAKIREESKVGEYTCQEINRRKIRNKVAMVSLFCAIKWKGTMLIFMLKLLLGKKSDAQADTIANSKMEESDAAARANGVLPESDA
ncbi:hypothetical protein Ddye_029789 [Dipteronia dyeriana]|uniref:Uncharacterized protein n=1 Tax=Dipteronia dyeriana TaxID=168575 RepID=A0AAD9WLV6_9ROSI|nr:hypothetical protein Ddye_029789 [Dipteronia dyeriana]